MPAGTTTTSAPARSLPGTQRGCHGRWQGRGAAPGKGPAAGVAGARRQQRRGPRGPGSGVPWGPRTGTSGLQGQRHGLWAGVCRASTQLPAGAPETPCRGQPRLSPVSTGHRGRRDMPGTPNTRKRTWVRDASKQKGHQQWVHPESQRVPPAGVPHTGLQLPAPPPPALLGHRPSAGPRPGGNKHSRGKRGTGRTHTQGPETAAPPHPAAALSRLGPGGRCVIPPGRAGTPPSDRPGPSVDDLGGHQLLSSRSQPRARDVDPCPGRCARPVARPSRHWSLIRAEGAPAGLGQGTGHPGSRGAGPEPERKPRLTPREGRSRGPEPPLVTRYSMMLRTEVAPRGSKGRPLESCCL